MNEKLNLLSKLLNHKLFFNSLQVSAGNVKRDRIQRIKETMRKRGDTQVFICYTKNRM